MFIDSSGLSTKTKNGPYKVTRDRLEDLAGRSGLEPSELQAVYASHQSDLDREADVMRRHGRADPTGVVTLARIGSRAVFGRLGKR